MPAKRSFYKWACKLKIMFLAKCDEIIAHSILKIIIVAHPKHPEEDESNRKAMNRNWSNQKANPALKTKAGNK